MARLPVLLTLALTAFVGGAALAQAQAQQGLIIEPWRDRPRATVPVAVLPRVTPASGLDVAVVPLATAPGAGVVPPPAPEQPVAARAKWSAPVVELLVDPWTRGAVAGVRSRPRWVPPSMEIIDPWREQDQALAEKKRQAALASAPALPSSLSF